MADETILRLKVTSINHTPEEITELIGMPCDKFWCVGAMRAKTIIREKNNGWIVDSGLPRSASLETHINTLLKRLAPFATKIRRLADEDDVCFSCVIYATEMPALCFDKVVIRQLGEMGAGLDIDLYMTGEE